MFNSGLNSGANSGDILPLPTARPDVTAFLETRRSNLAKFMTEPGPNADELTQILKIAARVPDHRKLAPWRFIVFQGEARNDIGTHIRRAFEKANPDALDERKEFEAARFMRAPLVVAVVSASQNCPRGTPEWEQVLSAGAVCYNLLIGSQSLGYGAQWLTEWYVYDAAVTAAMGLTEKERIAGLIYIGTPKVAAQERARPDIKDKVSFWSS